MRTSGLGMDMPNEPVSPETATRFLGCAKSCVNFQNALTTLVVFLSSIRSRLGTGLGVVAEGSINLVEALRVYQDGCMPVDNTLLLKRCL